MKNSPTYRFLVTPYEEDGQSGYLVELPDYPGCFAQGKTFEEAMDNIHLRYEEWSKAAKSLRNKSKMDLKVGEKNIRDNRNQMIQTFNIQVPRTLYVKLFKRAQLSKRSLSGFITMSLHELLK